MCQIGVNFMQRLLKVSVVLFLVSHGFSSAMAEETEPLLLVRTVYHVVLAWLALTAARAMLSTPALALQPIRRLSSRGSGRSFRRS